MDAIEIALVAGAVLASAAVGYAVVTYVIVHLPEDYLERPDDMPLWPDRPQWLQTTVKVGKNLLGAVIVAIGVLFALPGHPGPGTITILVGLTLLDIPGKRRLQRRILGQPKVLGLVNRLRARFGRPPLRVPPAVDDRVPRAVAPSTG